MNKEFVAAFKKANDGMRPNFMAVGGYDGMHLIYAALKKTGGKTDGDSLIAAMKGMAWESPRGPISIDPETRDIIQNIYIRKVEKKNGELYNVEFATFPSGQGPGQGRGAEVTLTSSPRAGESVDRRETRRTRRAKWRCPRLGLQSQQSAMPPCTPTSPGVRARRAVRRRGAFGRSC